MRNRASISVSSTPTPQRLVPSPRFDEIPDSKMPPRREVPLMLNGPPKVPVNLSRAEDKIRKHNPPFFNGAGEPLEAEKWIRAMEKIFKYMACTDAERLSCAVYQLTDDADFWWESVSRTITPERWKEFTWAEFKRILYQKYIPDCYREKKEAEFWNLKQERNSVIDYDRSFNQLSRYAPYLVDTEEKKARKFLKGLKPEIAVALAGQKAMDYAHTLSRAMDIESILPVERVVQPSTSKDLRGKRKWEGNRNDDNRGRQSGQQNSGNFNQNNQRGGRRPCLKCNRFHFGMCGVNSDSCHNCGKMGHFARGCRKSRRNNLPYGPNGENYQRQGQGGNPRTNQEPTQHLLPPPPPQPARAYALNQQQAARALGNLAGST